MNVLIFPSGSLVSKEIYDSLKFQKNIKIYGTDYDNNNFSYYLFDNYIKGCPFIQDKEGTVIFLNNIVNKYNIKYIFPAFDSVILFLKENEIAIGAKIICPDLDIIQICNSKLRTYQILKNIIPVPVIYNKSDEQLNFPLYSKPIIGYGTRNHKIIHNKEEMNEIDTNEYLILEYLLGKEYTVDCFTNKNGRLLYSGARERIRTSNGMSIQSKTVELDNIESIANKINNTIKITGSWFFQVKYDNHGQLKLLEIACRIPGSMCVNRVRGINFPLLSILMFENIDCEPLLFNKIDINCYKIYQNHYKTDITYECVYCDLDDTLIINNNINLDLIKFLYKCINNNIKLVLITRNDNPDLVLLKFKINIFDEIIKLPKNHNILKSTFITNTNSIFIDDSYKERYDVKQNCNIICLSPSDIELLL